jgi:uncharacterized protein YecE (DUF72 family)
MPECRIGCSGWEYPHWRGTFYPMDMPRPSWFLHYARVFDTVEVNNTFYRLPEAETFARWGERAPSRFLFAIKASRYLTHVKRLADAQDPLERLLGRAAPLGDHLGPVLYQLPPRWRCDIGRLRDFVSALPGGYLHAIEFRDPSWYDKGVFDLLDREGTTVCLHDKPGTGVWDLRVGSFTYARFHGGTRDGGYTQRSIDDASETFARDLLDRRPVYVYFNNDIGGHAIRDALSLREALASRMAPQ